MSIFRCVSCLNDFNIQYSRPFSLPCGDIFCEQCVLHIYNKKNNLLRCPIHKKEFSIEFNKFSNYFNTLTNINRAQLEAKDLGLYCIRHNNKKIKYFCEIDNNFLCENCLSQHEGHKYVEIKLNKENFMYEINSLKNNFDNLKNKYLNEKNKINQFFLKAKKNLEEQIHKIDNYFGKLISVINDKKIQMMTDMNNKEKINLKKLENLKNIFLISDEKCNFINNEFYYINNELLSKGDYETFYKTKKNFLKLIDNFYIYINKNIFNNNEVYNHKLVNYFIPNNEILEKNKLKIEKEENIFGKIDELTINLYNKKINSLFIPDINMNINMNKNTQLKKEKEKINIENNNNSININNIIPNNNFDSLLDKKSNFNDGDSFIDRQLVDTGNTFYLINKCSVKNVFKQQETDQSHNEFIINKDNSNYINKNDFIINNLNNINEIRKNYNNYNINDNKNINKLKKIKSSNMKKAPYKLLNIANNKEGNNYKKKEKLKINRTRENNSSTSYLISQNGKRNLNFNIKSEDNRNKLGKEKLNIHKRNSSIKKFYNLKNHPNKVIRENSLGKNREKISYIYTSNKNNSSMLTNNLINSYNKEYSQDINSEFFKKSQLCDKIKTQMLTDVNDKNKKRIKSKYSYKDINRRVIIRPENNKLNLIEKGIKRGRSTRQKHSFSEMEILI